MPTAFPPEMYEWLVLAWASGASFEDALEVYEQELNCAHGPAALVVWAELEEELDRCAPFDLPG